MGSIDRYIFPHDARVVCAGPGQPHRRDLDYAGVARHRPDDEPGQTIITFLGITSLVNSGAGAGHRADRADDCDLAHAETSSPPISEIIVMNAAGFSPFRLFRPFFFATCVVATLSSSSLPFSRPTGLRPDQAMGRRDHGDVLTNILQPGRFATARPEPDDQDPGTAAGRRSRRHLRRRPPRSQGARHHHRRPWHGA